MGRWSLAQEDEGADGWWLKEQPCPDGASLMGAAPPKGIQVWCALVDGSRHGRSWWWYDTGEKRYAGQFVQGKAHGWWNRWTREGALDAARVFRRGTLIRKIGWHPNGRKRYEGNAQDGMDGVPWTEWYPNGKKKLEAFYKDGEMNGAWIEWYSDGSKGGEGSYVSGLPDGAYAWWHPNGHQAVAGGYQRGIKHGTWTYWDEEGKLARVEQWKQGALQTPTGSKASAR